MGVGDVGVDSRLRQDPLGRVVDAGVVEALVAVAARLHDFEFGEASLRFGAHLAADLEEDWREEGPVEGDGVPGAGLGADFDDAGWEGGGVDE